MHSIFPGDGCCGCEGFGFGFDGEEGGLGLSLLMRERMLAFVVADLEDTILVCSLPSVLNDGLYGDQS